MLTLHLDYEGKSTRVGLAQLPARNPSRQWLTRTSAGPVASQRVTNGIAKGEKALALDFQALLVGDPELDLELAGTAIDNDSTSTAFFDPGAPQPVPIGDFKDVEIVYDAQGVEKTRRPRLKRSANLDDIHPIKISKRIPLLDVLTSFVIKQSLQVAHVDGLTYDFLRALAESLTRKGEAGVLGAGPKGNQPLVLREGGTAYRAFLVGETDAEGRYKLLMLLSDQELKLPENRADRGPGAAA